MHRWLQVREMGVATELLFKWFCVGDEIISVNGKSVKGRTKVEVAKLIQASKVRGSSIEGVQRGCVLFIGRSSHSLHQIACPNERRQNPRYWSVRH